MIIKLESSWIESINYLEKICFKEEAWLYSQIESHVKNYGGQGYLCNNNLIAYCLYCKSIDAIELLRIGVDPKYRHTGLAKKLIYQLFQYKLGIFLEVKESNLNAILLYESLDFKCIHSRKNYYPDGKDALIYKIDYNESRANPIF